MNKYIKKIVLLLLICIPLFSLQAKKRVSTQKKKTQSSAVVKKRSTRAGNTKKSSISRKRTTSKKPPRKTSRTRRGAVRSTPKHATIYVAQPVHEQESIELEDTSAATDGVAYNHALSRTSFPMYIGEYKRSKIIGKSNSDEINVMYRVQPKAKKPSFIVSICRSEEASEGRLRNEYRNDIQKVAQVEKLPLPLPAVLREVGEKYTCYGVQGTFVLKDSTLTQLRVYECGTWIMKILFSTRYTDEKELETFADSIVKEFEPTRLTALNPLNINPTITFDKDLLSDTVFMTPMIAGGMSKLEWARKNVWPREKASGFPDLYFNLHLYAIDKFLEEADKKNLSRSAIASAYYNDLKAIKEAGFMSEFIMDQFNGILIVSPLVKFNFNGYYKWLENRKLTVNLNKQWYSVVYRKG